MTGSNLQTAVDHHRRGHLTEAERLYRSVLSGEPDQFDALHYLGVLKLQQGNPKEAFTHISAALKNRPDSTNAMCNLGAALMALDRPAEALAISDRILAINPNEEEARYNRAAALQRLHRHREALEAFDKVLASRPQHANALLNRGNILASLGHFSEALSSFDQALAVVPDFLPAALNRGNALLKLERFDDALAAYEAVLKKMPENGDALNGRAICFKELGRYEEALAVCAQVLAANPNHLRTLNTKGNTLLQLHRPSEALATFGLEHCIAPDDATLVTNRAFALHALERYQEALNDCDAALRLNPNLANALLLRGHIFSRLGQPDEAASSYERVIDVEPDNRFAFGASIMSHLSACHWDQVDRITGIIEQQIENGRIVIPPFNILGLKVDPPCLLRCTENYVRQQIPHRVQRVPQRAREPHDRIRIAYLSADFRSHPVAYLIAKLIEEHDRSRFEIHGVSYAVADDSKIRARLIEAFDHFHDCRLQSDDEVASLLDRLEIDIAIDLGGHTFDARPGVLARRPAPVQVNFLGYPATTGADFIDYIIADNVVLPFDQQPFYAERIVHLPNCYLPQDSYQPVTAHTPTRRDAGLPDGGFVFCCFNNSYKLTAPVFDIWMRLLDAVTGSVLWLSQLPEVAQANLRRQAEARGIDPQRLIFAPRIEPHAAHLARQRLADLFLDTLPYNAHTTASDALLVGLPVITCRGNTFAGRVAASLLHAVGLSEFVTTSLEEYEALALRLATNEALLRDARERLERNQPTCPLFDTDKFRRNIETAYTTMWKTFQCGNRPESFTVERGSDRSLNAG